MGSLPVVVDCFCLLRWQGQAPSIAGLTNISSGRNYIIIAGGRCLDGSLLGGWWPILGKDISRYVTATKHWRLYYAFTRKVTLTEEGEGGRTKHSNSTSWTRSRRFTKSLSKRDETKHLCSLPTLFMRSLALSLDDGQGPQKRCHHLCLLNSGIDQKEGTIFFPWELLCNYYIIIPLWNRYLLRLG